ncbi:MAG: 2-oxoacid:acceptor oxidoreductase family protein [Desulfosarcina sp.]|nr:2-oxoacid:acceptor oxidoreductase family protein [Desulfobacterales bacterium]
MYHDVIMAGFGGQGILMVGDILALAGMIAGKHVSWMPAYGVEMRGGTANCTVVISDERVGSPITGTPHGCLIMNKPSLEKYESWVKPGGLLVANGTFINKTDLSRDDIEVLLVPTTDIADAIGDQRTASMVALGAYVELSKAVTFDNLFTALSQTFKGKKKKLVPINEKALEQGREFALNRL